MERLSANGEILIKHNVSLLYNLFFYFFIVSRVYCQDCETVEPFLCIYVSMYLCIYVSMYLCIYVSMYLCIYVSMYICIYVSMYLCIYVSMYLCIYVSMYLCIYVSMYLSRVCCKDCETVEPFLFKTIISVIGKYFQQIDQ